MSVLPYLITCLHLIMIDSNQTPKSLLKSHSITANTIADIDSRAQDVAEGICEWYSGLICHSYM